jgi:hypothetical protein
LVGQNQGAPDGVLGKRFRREFENDFAPGTNVLDEMLNRLQGQLPQHTYDAVTKLVSDVQMRHVRLTRKQFLEHFQAVCQGAPRPPAPISHERLEWQLEVLRMKTCLLNNEASVLERERLKLEERRCAQVESNRGLSS